MIEIRFRFFGAMRAFGDGRLLRVPAGSTVAQVKELLAQQLSAEFANFQNGLLAQSAIGDARAVLGERDAIPLSGELAVLPPVCGG